MRCTFLKGLAQSHHINGLRLPLNSPDANYTLLYSSKEA
jgi:hypothetical protein